MFPWMPPPGVPSEVLQNIRLELLKKLWELIQKGMDPMSAQTCPAISERSLEEYSAGSSARELLAQRVTHNVVQRRTSFVTVLSLRN